MKILPVFFVTIEGIQDVVIFSFFLSPNFILTVKHGIYMDS